MFIPQELTIEHFDFDNQEFSSVDINQLKDIASKDSQLELGLWDDKAETIFFLQDQEKFPLLWLNSADPFINLNPVLENGSIYKIYEIASELNCWVLAEGQVLFIPDEAPLIDPKLNIEKVLDIDTLINGVAKGKSISDLINHNNSTLDKEDSAEFERQKKILNWVVIIGFLLTYVLYQVFKK